MPFYDYRCEECGDFEEFASIDGRNDVDCPECSEPATILLSAHSVKGIPSTIGAQADANTKKMGRYELEEKRRQAGVPEMEKKKAAQAKNRKLASMTPNQKERYIMEGKM